MMGRCLCWTWQAETHNNARMQTRTRVMAGNIIFFSAKFVKKMELQGKERCIQVK